MTIIHALIIVLYHATVTTTLYNVTGIILNCLYQLISLIFVNVYVYIASRCTPITMVSLDMFGIVCHHEQHWQQSRDGCKTHPQRAAAVDFQGVFPDSAHRGHQW